jgi:hypothetical protein
MSLVTEIISKIKANDPTVVDFKHGASIVDSKQMQQLGQALKTNTVVKHVNVEKSGLSNADAIIWGEMIKVNKTIEYLDLGYNKIQASGMIAIGEALATNKTITEIKLHRQNDDCGTPAEEAFVKLWATNVTLRRCYATLHDRRCNQTNTAGEVRNKTIAFRIAEGREWNDLDPTKAEEYAASQQKKREEAKALEAKANAPITAKVASRGGNYTLKELTCKKEFLPDDIESLFKELSLNDAEFETVFKVDKAAFAKLPKWKQTSQKKAAKLY